jgi:hypothetical protein
MASAWLAVHDAAIARQLAWKQRKDVVLIIIPSLVLDFFCLRKFPCFLFVKYAITAVNIVPLPLHSVKFDDKAVFFRHKCDGKIHSTTVLF